MNPAWGKVNTDNETHPILVQAMLGEEHPPEALSNLITSLRVATAHSHQPSHVPRQQHPDRWHYLSSLRNRTTE